MEDELVHESTNGQEVIFDPNKGLVGTEPVGVLPGSFEGGSCTVPTGLLPIGRSSAKRETSTQKTGIRQVYLYIYIFFFKKQKLIHSSIFVRIQVAD